MVGSLGRGEGGPGSSRPEQRRCTKEEASAEDLKIKPL